MGREDTPKRLTVDAVGDLAKAVGYMFEELSKLEERMRSEHVDAIAGRQWIKGEEGLQKLSDYVQLLSNSLRIRLMNRSSISLEDEIASIAKPKRPNRTPAESPKRKAPKKANPKSS